MQSNQEPEEKKETESGRKTRGSTLWKGIAAVLLVLLLVAAAVRVLQDFSPEELTGKSAEQAADGCLYAIDADTVLDMRAFGAGTVLLTGNDTLYLDAAGGKIANLKHSYVTPAMTAYNKTMLVYDRGQTAFRIEKNGAVLQELTAEGALLTAAIGKKENYAIATLANGGFQSRCSVYSSNGEKQFEWGSARDIITAVALSADGRHAAAAVIGSENAAFYSKVFVFDFKAEEPLYSFTYSDATVCSLSFMHGNSLLVATDTFVNYIENGVEQQLLVYNAAALCATATVPEQSFSLLLDASFDSSGEQLLYVWGRGGSVKVSAVTAGSGMEKISSNGKNAAVAGEKNLACFTNAGVLCGEQTLAQNIRRLVVSGKKVFCLTDGGIFVYPVTSTVKNTVG